MIDLFLPKRNNVTVLIVDKNRRLPLNSCSEKETNLNCRKAVYKVMYIVQICVKKELDVKLLKQIVDGCCQEPR